MAVDNLAPWEHPEVSEASAPRYILGYVLSVALAAIALVLVTRHMLAPVSLLATIAVLCLVTVIVKLKLLFHLDLSETQRWNTLTLVLNVPLLVLSVGLTLWMFSQLYGHVMAPGTMGIGPMAPGMTMMH